MSKYEKRKNGISADDPAAIVKLEAKLAELTAGQEQMKKSNTHYRKHKTMKGYPGLTDHDASVLDEKIRKGYSWEQQPYPRYLLTNNSANIRRISKRIEGLKKRDTLLSGDDENPSKLSGWVFDGGTVEMNAELNRIQIFFDAKPNEEVRRELKGRGFKWAPSQSAWQRQINANGLYAVRQIKCIQAKEEG